MYAQVLELHAIQESAMSWGKGFGWDEDWHQPSWSKGKGKYKGYYPQPYGMNHGKGARKLRTVLRGAYSEDDASSPLA